MYEPLDGATPIDRDDMKGLILHLTTQAELNEAEAANILAARIRAVDDRRLRRILLTPLGLRTLHGYMFNQVWEWAGRYRVNDPSIGSDWSLIPEEVAQLCEDAAAWHVHGSYDWPERAIRFHHRLVKIHPFVNGNGRHARLVADLMLRYHGLQELEWPADRTAYISALRSADDHEYRPLLELVRPLSPPSEGDLP